MEGAGIARVAPTAVSPERFSDVKRRERQDLILAETTRALAEQGCCRMRVEDIAQRAGVGKGTIYLDFGSKEELISGALKRASDALLGEISKRVEGRRNPGERVLEAFRAIADIARARSDLVPLLERNLPCDRQYHEAGVAPSAALAGYLRQLIEQGKKAGALAEEIDPELLAHASVSLLSSAAWRRLVESEGPDTALHKVEKTLPISLRERRGA